MTWTLDELADRAARALADLRVGNGRVTPVPDARLIRWYATIGLVDRPLPGPGRAVRYGPRHLLQLVAVKRLQARGQPLVEIQRRLAGATDATLERIAGIDLDAVDLGEASRRPARSVPAPAQSAAPSSPAPAPSAAPSSPAPAPSAAPSSPAPPASAPALAGRFWTAMPATSESRLRAAAVDAAPAPLPGSVSSVDGGTGVQAVHGLRIGPVTVLIPEAPDQDDLDAIAAAARPLLDLLAARGLLKPTEGAP